MPWWGLALVIVAVVWVVSRIWEMIWFLMMNRVVRSNWRDAHRELRQENRVAIERLLILPVSVVQDDNPEWWKEWDARDRASVRWEHLYPTTLQLAGAIRGTESTSVMILGGGKLVEEWEIGQRELQFRKDLIEAYVRIDIRQVEKMRQEWRVWVDRLPLS